LAQDREQVEAVCRAFRERGLEPLCVSSLTGDGLEALRMGLRERVREEKAPLEKEEEKEN
jgi:hypothetical protein